MIRGPISLLIVGSISVFMFVLVALGPRAFHGILPEPVLALLEGNGQMRESGSPGGWSSLLGGPSEGQTPSDFLEDDPDGLVARGPIAALAGNRPVFIEDVIEGHRSRISNDIPAEVMTIRPISGCKLTPPETGTLVGHATAGSSDLKLPLLTYGDDALAQAVQGFVNGYRKTGFGRAEAGDGLGYQAYDVAVTETTRPVYLVLFNWYGNRIWNIHLAPGARVERVVLLGGDQAGVANLDPVVPVEVIPAAGLAGCGIEPAYTLNPNARFFSMAKVEGASPSDREEATARVAALENSISAYDTWFRDSFGVKADEIRAGFDQGMISVVGPVPGEAEPKAIYAAIKGARIRTTQDAYFEIVGQSALPESFAGRVEAIATTFAFGDLSYLRQGAKF
jgi:hypothetical protein